MRFPVQVVAAVADAAIIKEARATLADVGPLLSILPDSLHIISNSIISTKGLADDK
jgi:hypothetical protein